MTNDGFELYLYKISEQKGQIAVLWEGKARSRNLAGGRQCARPSRWTATVEKF